MSTLIRTTKKPKYLKNMRSLHIPSHVFQDKNVAFKIFELGLKKFGHNPEYIVCYIDFMGHLNGNSNLVVKCLFRMHILMIF